MTYGRKTGGRDWKKGQTGNPKGSSLTMRTNGALKKLNKIEVEAVLNKFLFDYSLDDLMKFAQDKKNSVLECAIASILLNAYKEGDQARINWIFERLVGKVTEKVQHQLPKPTIVRMFNNDGSIVLGAEIKDKDE